MIANGVVKGTHNLDSHWAYSGPFAAQWLWVLIILVGFPFAPESVRTGPSDGDNANEG